MTTKIQVRRDSAANWTSVNPTLSDGEIGFETDTNKFKIGANSTAWNVLDYAAGSITVGNGLYTDSYGVTKVKTADSYGISINWDGGVKAKTMSPVIIDSYGNITLSMGQGLTTDSYGRASVKLGTGLSFDSYGYIVASGGNSGAVDLQNYSGLTLDGYGKLAVALGHANSDQPWNLMYTSSGLRLDSYGLALDLANAYDDGIYSGLEVGSYGLKIKTSMYGTTWDKTNGVYTDSYGLKIAIGGANGGGEAASGLKTSSYGLSIRLKEMWGMPQPSGLTLNEYGMEVFTGYDYSGGLTKDNYGLKVVLRNDGGLEHDSMLGIRVKPGIAYYNGGHPGLQSDSYGLHVQLAPTWSGGKGLELGSYGLSVKTNGNSISDYDGYGLKVNVDSGSQLKADSMYGLTIDTTKPAKFTDSYGELKTVFKTGATFDPLGNPVINITIAEQYSSMQSFDTFITLTHDDGTGNKIYVEKIAGAINPDGTITSTTYSSKGFAGGTIQFVVGMYGSLVCQITANTGISYLRAYVKADIVNDYSI